MKRRTVLKLAGGAAAASFLLAACGGRSSAGDEAGGTTIELWTAWTEGADTALALKQKIKEFEEATGYTVNQTNFTYDMLHEKLIASAAGGNLPDAVWGLPEYVGEFDKMGILADLSEAWEAWEDKDKVSDAIKATMTIKGRIIGFPYETTARAYLVHDDVIGQAGVTVPKTWDDVLAVGTKVEDATGSSFFGVAGTGVRAPQELLVYLAQYDLDVASEVDGGYRNTWVDNPDELAKAAKVFDFYGDLIKSGAASPNSPTYGWEETDENFATALTATYVSGNWLAEREASNPEAMSDVSVHPIPYPKDGKPATYIECKPLMVMAGSQALEAATELSRTFASTEWQTAAFPDRSALNDVQTDTKWSTDFSALLDTGISYPPITLAAVTQAMIDALAMRLQEGKDSTEVATWLSGAINTALEESGDAPA
ncbi:MULTISPECIES: extracellular solute-binding protein [unclassified Actinomyces]|uniref:ABC transporter substrate-binding protein n=1 Tax=unclassified Actinomyces TaxID=2609248 RepID=UPI002016B705|nr:MULTISPECIES: extracellular solute-binding protein [unclassified Actinomyces]MCL3777180.1 extracellular solute-binding protein [Actinomyces sp. AC-20-1]MCL3788996.1 extracellular solute-binding protein [Actinomyces sp. 187325]MCL3791351.1 extracellular solute-binding protein [Actinomyces sp. 186855]MCL3793938.1 extracellular solute-binding protein [Actinomyces sp. 217892]